MLVAGSGVEGAMGLPVEAVDGPPDATGHLLFDKLRGLIRAGSLIGSISHQATKKAPRQGELTRPLKCIPKS